MSIKGQYEHTLDAKNRLVIPTKHRAELGLSFVICRGTDGCLFLYSEYEFEEFGKKLLAEKMIEARNLHRFYFGTAEDVECDAHGRIIIPQKLKEYAGIEKNVIVVGAGKHAEIWAADKWAKLCETTMTDEAILEDYARMGV